MIHQTPANPLRSLGLVLLLAASAVPALADAIQMTGGTHYSASYDNGGMGSGRGIGFVANSSFDMSSFGIDISVLSATSDLYKFDVFASTDGHSAGSLLTSTSFNLAVGNGWQDFAFNYSFVAGNAYVINFARLGGGHLGTLGTHYSWEPSAHINYGVLSIVEGFEAEPPQNDNPLVMHTRMNYTAGSTNNVPDHGSTLLLLAGGFCGMIAFARRFLV